MRSILTCTALFALTLFLTNCKKDQAPTPNTDHNKNELAVTNAYVAGVVAPNTVVTIAGEYHFGAPHYVDGIGRNARFYQPYGIQLKDGILYVADNLNSAIRKVDINTGAVTTLSLPAATGSNRILGPTDIGISNNGDINIIGSNYDSEYSQFWRFKADKSLTATVTYFFAAFGALAKDPYMDQFLLSAGLTVQKLGMVNGEIRFTGVDINSDILYDDVQLRGETFGSIFVGYNKVIYFSMRGKIFKVTPGGVSEQIYKDQHFTYISSIIVNKDSRTVYVADDGAIKAISNGKATTLVGPTSVFDNRDGVGRNADVHANRLAFGKTENIIYFSDYGANAIRKLTLN
jgi:hypothetical protein